MHYVQIHKLPGHDDVKLPEKMSSGASGYDLHAAVEEPVVLHPGERKLIPTGFALSMPEGWKPKSVRAADSP
ncbi:Deoxyuridine 5'-triphosphate nucleotidohydrolase [Paenibacillus sp. P1XP2]|nr:Deoxyuridine 5'-triphosphate nucleotidohydrolase [Paenibacillus sp. P1XP2]